MPVASASFSFTGGTGSLARLDASAASSVVATVDDTTGLLTITWSVEATDDSGGTYTLTPSGTKGSICTFTSGAVGTGGLLVCTAVTSTGTLTAKAKWQVKTAAGYDILVVGEQFEHNSTYGWTGPINNVLRNMVAGGGSTFVDSAFRITGSSDATKRIAFEADTSITTGTTRTVTIPDKNGTLAMTSDIVGPTFADNVFRITGSADATKLAAFEVDGFTTATTRTFTLPNASATVSCLSVAERFTGEKSFDDGKCVLIGSVTGQVTLKAAASAGSVVATFPDANGTVTCDGVASTFSAAKTFSDGMCVLAGSSSGTTTVKANATAGTTTCTFPAQTGIVILDAGAQSISGAKTFADSTLLLSGSSSGALTLKAPAAASTYAATLPAATGTLSMIDFAESITGAKTFGDTKLIMAGSTSGTTTLKANATAGTTTATFQAASGTVAYLTDATAQYDNVLFKQIADAAATTTTAATTFYYFGYARTITALYWLPRGTSTQDATNYATILVERYNSSNVLVGTVATRSTTPADGGTITGGAPYSLGAITNASASAGDYLKITISKPGTGVSLASAEVCVVC